MSALNTYVATTGVLRLRLRIDHRTNVAVIWFWYKRTIGKIRAYHRYGYGRTTGTLRAYHWHSYGCTTDTATGVPQTWLRAYHRHGYGRTTDMATGVLRLRLLANVRAYYVNFLLRIPYLGRLTASYVLALYLNVAIWLASCLL